MKACPVFHLLFKSKKKSGGIVPLWHEKQQNTSIIAIKGYSTALAELFFFGPSRYSCTVFQGLSLSFFFTCCKNPRKLKDYYTKLQHKRLWCHFSQHFSKSCLPLFQKILPWRIELFLLLWVLFSLKIVKKPCSKEGYLISKILSISRQILAKFTCMTSFPFFVCIWLEIASIWDLAKNYFEKGGSEDLIFFRTPS